MYSNGILYQYWQVSAERERKKIVKSSAELVWPVFASNLYLNHLLLEKREHLAKGKYYSLWFGCVFFFIALNLYSGQVNFKWHQICKAKKKLRDSACFDEANLHRSPTSLSVFFFSRFFRVITISNQSKDQMVYLSVDSVRKCVHVHQALNVCIQI